MSRFHHWFLIRADRKSQVRKCFGFCTADFGSLLAYESAEQNSQTLPWLETSYQLCSWSSKKQNHNTSSRNRKANNHNGKEPFRSEVTMNFPFQSPSGPAPWSAWSSSSWSSSSSSASPSTPGPRASSASPVSHPLCMLHVFVVQGKHGGQWLGFVEYDLVVPLSAQFCVGILKLGRNGRSVGQHCGTSKIKSTKYSRWPPRSPYPVDRLLDRIARFRTRDVNGELPTKGATVSL